MMDKKARNDFRRLREQIDSDHLKPNTGAGDEKILDSDFAHIAVEFQTRLGLFAAYTTLPTVIRNVSEILADFETRIAKLEKDRK